MLIKELHGIDFSVHLQDGARLGLPVSNLSTNGIGFLRHGWKDWPPVGHSLHGELRLSGRAFPMAAKVAHLSSQVVGCTTKVSSRDFSQAFADHFSVELAAASLREMNPAMLKKEPDGGQPRYFSSERGYECFLVQRSHAPAQPPRIERFYLSFLGNYIESADGERSAFGHIEEDPVRADIAYKGSELVSGAAALSPEMAEMARRFVQSIQGLTDPQKAQIIAALSRA